MPTAVPPTHPSPRPSSPGYDVTPLHGAQEGVEVDVVHPTGCWSLRFAVARSTGAVSLVVVDHATGHPVVAEVLRPPHRPGP